MGTEGGPTELFLRSPNNPADLVDVRRDQIKGAHGWDGVSDSPVGADPVGKSHACARMTLTSTAMSYVKKSACLTQDVNRLSPSPSSTKD